MDRGRPAFGHYDVFSGTLSGTTTSTGTFRITVTVTDGSSTYVHVFTLFARYTDPTVPTLAVLSSQLTDARVGQSVSYTLSPSGGAPPFTWTVAAGSALPPGLSLYSGTSISAYSSSQTVGLTYIQGQPTTAGPYSFDLIATDATGAQMRRTFTLNVMPMAIIGGSLRTPVTGVAYSEQLTAAGGTPPYTFTYGLLGINTNMFPPGITATPSGLISGTTSSTGSFGFTVTAQDSAGHTFTTTYSYIVTNALGLEVTTAPLFGARLGIGTSTTLGTNGTSTYTWTVSAGSLPPGLALVPSGSSTLLTGAPQGFGTFSYTLRAIDNTNPANFADRAFTVLIAPMTVNTHRAVQMPAARVGTPYSFTFQLSGGTPPYTFAASPLSPLPPGLSLSADGVLSGTPSAIGSYAFTFQATDSNGFAGYLSSLSMNVLGLGATNPLQGRSITFDQASVGIPYPGELDGLASGGVPPYTWALAPGSTLPPGISILPGSNGVSSYLGGIPSSAGTYVFNLNCTDAVGQTANAIVTLVVSPIAATPSTFPNGTVGVPFSATYTPSGGTAPYSFALVTGTSVPPGLSLNAAGTLSGTPTTAGWFATSVTITDSLGNSLTTPRVFDIDNAGQAQGIGMPPAIQLNYVLTSPAPAPVPIAITSTSGAIPFTAAIMGIPGATLTPANGSAPTSLNLNLDPTGLVAGTYAGVAAVNAPTSANLYTHTPIVLTVTAPPVCNYSLSPNAGTLGFPGGSTSFAVSADPLCAWTATTTDAFITITSGSGTGPGNVTFSVGQSGARGTLTGHITVGGQTYTLTQFGPTCAISINPTSVSATASGGSAIVSVTTPSNACAWKATGLGATGVTGTGNGTVTFTIPPNGGTAPQVLNASISLTAPPSTQTFTVNQSGVNCTVSLGSSSSSMGSAGGSGSVNVSTPAGCTYNTVPGPGWISITSGDTGAGPGPVPLNFTVAPNSTTTARSGTLSIGGQSFLISQDPTPCSVTVDASLLSSPFATAGGFAGVNITANGANCSWTASSGATWATLSAMSGSGNASVIVTATSNAASTTPRSTSLTIAGQSVTVTQSGTTCNYSLGSSTASVPFAGGSGSVTVTAPSVCGWNSSLDPTAPWLSIPSSGSAGTSDLTFTATPNPTSSPRSGTLTVAGLPYTVTQGAAPCNYVLSSSNTTLAAAGASSSFTFTTAAAGCSATALSYSSWLTTSTTSSPDGTSGTVNFTAVANAAGSTRTGTIQLGGQTFTVFQTGAACAYSLNAYGVLLGMAGGGGSVLGSESAIGCTPAVGTDQPSIVTLGTLTGPVSNIFTLPYTVTNFNSTNAIVRRMTITFGGQVFTVKQTSW